MVTEPPEEEEDWLEPPPIDPLPIEGDASVEGELCFLAKSLPFPLLQLVPLMLFDAEDEVFTGEIVTLLLLLSFF